MTKATRNTRRAASKTASNPVASLTELVGLTFKTEADVAAIMAKAEDAANAARGTTFQAFIRVAGALQEVHKDGLDQAGFDAAYKADVMAAFVAGFIAKGKDEKAAKLAAGAPYNHMRAAMLGLIEGIEHADFTSFQAYAKHVRDEAPDLFTKKAETRGRKAGHKAKDVRPSIDVKELSGKRGHQKDIAQEILDLIRIAKDRGMLEDVRDTLADLLAE